jgi:hypothetical protein
METEQQFERRLRRRVEVSPPQPDRLYCYPCQVLTNGEDQLHDHLHGTKHRRRMQAWLAGQLQPQQLQ